MFKSKSNKYSKLEEPLLDSEELKNKIIIASHTKSHSIPPDYIFELILSKYFELYDKDQLDNFPSSYHVYIHKGLYSSIADIKYKYNLKLHKKRHEVKSINDVYEIFYSVLSKLNQDKLK